jgi:hypothetical protein
MSLMDAIRALREEGNRPSERAQETRARILGTLRKTKKRRARVMLVVLPIAAVLVGASASAGVGGKLPAVWRSITAMLGFADKSGGTDGPAQPKLAAAAPLAPPAASLAEPTETAAPPQPEPEVVATAPAPTPEAPSPPRAAPPSRASSERAAPRPAPKIDAPSDSPEPAIATAITTSSAPPAQEPEAPRGPDSLALYRTAHRLHFATRDAAGALAAWDAYLAADPGGAFALEARYNRALCLVRLRRFAEARRALIPFADGTLGGYRRSEARALLDTMDGTADHP